jgi:hypothetical protein
MEDEPGGDHTGKPGSDWSMPRLMWWATLVMLFITAVAIASIGFVLPPFPVTMALGCIHTRLLALHLPWLALDREPQDVENN